MTLRPITTRILVELEPLETTTPGGLHLPADAVWKQERRPDARWGKAVAVGSKVRDVGEGDRVLVSGWMNDSLDGYGYGGRGERDGMVMVEEEQVFAVEEQTP